MYLTTLILLPKAICLNCASLPQSESLEPGFLPTLDPALSACPLSVIRSVSHLLAMSPHNDLFCFKFWNSIPSTVLGTLGGQCAV